MFIYGKFSTDFVKGLGQNRDWKLLIRKSFPRTEEREDADETRVILRVEERIRAGKKLQVN